MEARREDKEGYTGYRGDTGQQGMARVWGRPPGGTRGEGLSPRHREEPPGGARPGYGERAPGRAGPGHNRNM